MEFRDAALIVVDLQRGFMNEHTRHLCAPVERFQNEFGYVVATKYFRRPDSVMNELLSVRGFERGSADTELAFAARADADVLEKSGYSCVTSDLLEGLRARGLRHAYVCGVDTDQCVLMVAADLLQNDVVPVVCQDLTASAAGPHYHECGLYVLRRLIGEQQVRPVLHNPAIFG